MQYHLNGYRTGSPDVHPKAEPREDCEIDVLVVGTGPAGLTLAAYLAGFADINTVIVERREGPLEKGQADGVSCRTMEMFNCFGFVEQVIREAYGVNEATFWKPDPDAPDAIMRSGRVQDVEDGLSEMPHVILNQARVHDMYLEVMRNAPTRMEPLYGQTLVDLRRKEDGFVAATLEDAQGERQIKRARYVVGCDGARSRVRKAIGLELQGDSANKAWGVMDILATTDFPDIRYKSLIQSASEGTILLIPREGGYMVRMYVELDQLNPDERVSARNLSAQDLIAAAGRILRPYTLDVKDVVWWSVYEIGQRLTPAFDDGLAGQDPRIFIAGDACHTHSPKAGQGMNVSMGDAFNLGWKLVSVLRGQMPAALLRSYSAERQAVAQELIDFDQEFARIMSAPPQDHDVDGQRRHLVQDYFVKHGRYAAGVLVRYGRSDFTGDTTHQHLASGLQIGMRFHSAPVIRLGDGKPVHLGHVQQADARWLLCAFTGGGGLSAQLARLGAFGAWLHHDPASPVLRYTPKGADPDALFDARCVLDAHHHDLSVADLSAAFRPTKGRFGLIDYEKAFCVNRLSGEDIYQMRGIDRTHGCLAIIRPDQHIADILPLTDTARLAAYFDRIMIAPR